MYRSLSIFCVLALAEANLLEDLLGGSSDSEECKVQPYDYSTYNISCGVRPESCPESYYRSIDGSCNNLNFGWWGTPLTPYIRFLKNSYADGIYETPKTKDNEELPNARETSLTLYKETQSTNPIWALSFMSYAQIIAHDLGLTGGVGQGGIYVEQCCNEGQITQRAKTDPRCDNIVIPKNDPYNGPAGRVCMNFVRTVTTLDLKNCVSAGKVAEQLNNVTSFLDASFIYGSYNATLDILREKKGGRLKYVPKKDTQFLIQAENPLDLCFVKSSSDTCFMAGDERVNQNTPLTVLQIVYLFHHNYIANELAKLNPHWDDEKIFQETRNIVIAVHQYIFYYELLFYILGGTPEETKGIVYIGATDYINDYNPLVNPGTGNEFSTAAYRVLHTLITGPIKLYNESRTVDKTIRLKDWMDKPSIILEGDNYRELIRGIATQPMDEFDAYFTNDILNYLFQDGALGQDLKSVDIARGRDHGLGTYVEAIAKCCLGKKPTTFEELEEYIDEKYVKILSKLYKNVADVELHVGISVEKRDLGKFCGKVACCFIKDQFKRTRTGDRYFFENNQHPSAFNLKQLNSIRQTSKFAMLLCLIKGINFMQPQAFFQISLINPLLPCSAIPKLDISLWKDTSGGSK